MSTSPEEATTAAPARAAATSAAAGGPAVGGARVEPAEGAAPPAPDTPPDTPTAAPSPVAGESAGLRLLGEMRAEIGRADSKASILVALIGVAAGALAGALGAGRLPGPDALPAPAAALWWLGVAAWAAGLGSLLWAVVPRYRRSAWRPGLPLSFFGDVRRAALAGGLAEALRLAERDPLPGLVSALHDTSRIVAAKHHWIRVGVACFAMGALAIPAALAAG
ncbi:Pycsar system effector family protein [Allostreptomyces psammosilenae]|uniref:Pycsar effector protein domain-containing protein n=1 Tax=Allostreptomyces psammosilenae TaxID=1892865 RepID=A0A852ZV91_9ACTN|nr:Pycsar system effector family protein [Allostreptomyces psammosilenae]NYI05845.1 hypothetical protein [Allostreptomyces psammosilenae]